MTSKPPHNSSTTIPPLPPNQTLYLQNLNDKIRKPDLRTELYTLFSTYGVVLDVNALKTMKSRGQAHIIFRDVAAATQAMRALQGFEFFGKEMRISYAKGKSHAISKLDGTYSMVAPGGGGGGGVGEGEKVPFAELPGAPSVHPPPPAPPAAPAGAAAGVKRQRDEESDEGEEMDVEDDDD
ncbi:unnamed protein product [Tuber aestivum]|uniref:RRM domain-containing protein n=1 Tax=Tuber aestivum TaxID=59557 RepID=A0A292PI68_9PEZI|nr:unnamed protein product [Tuber aestivum]